MNLTPKSYPASSPPVQTLSGDTTVFDNTPDYPSASHTELHPEVMGNRSRQVPGLGILHCGMEMPLSQMRVCPGSESLHLPSNNWQDHIMPGQGFPETSLSTGGFPATTTYEPYEGRPAVSNSTFSFPNVPSHNLDTSLCYSPNVEVRASGSAFYDQFSGTWPITPRSRTTTPSGNAVRVKEEFDRSWDAPTSHRPFFPDARGENRVENVSHVARAPVNSTYFASQMPTEAGSERLLEVDPDIGCPIDRDRSNSADISSVELSPKLERDNLRTCRRRKSPTVNGLQCTVCGYLFTRRSNCREHMKRHDPNRKRDYGCETCGKSFGRRTDLKRHVDSIHHGTRRFGCDQCGRRFTRQDTLTRHCADGCRRKQRKPDRPESPIPPSEPIQSYPSPPASLESQLATHHPESLDQPYALQACCRPNTVNGSLGYPE